MIVGPDGVLDDLVVYRQGEQEFLVLVANAANTATVYAELRSRAAGYDTVVADATGETALIAIQGPAAAGILASATGLDVAAMRYYAGAFGDAAGFPAWVARTGYTGEDGFEVFCLATPLVCGRRWPRRAPRPAWSRPGWPPAIRSGLRPACRCTATSSART